MPSTNSAAVVDNVTPAEAIASGWTKFNLHWHDYEGVSLTNRSGGSTVAGDVHVVSGANDASAILGDTVNTYQKCVVAMAVISNNAAGEYARSGYISAIKSTGTINRGDWIRKSATTKCVESTGVNGLVSATAAPRGAIGIACAAASGGFVAAMLFDKAATPVFPRGHIFGLTLSNSAGDVTNDLDVAAGECKADDGLTDMVLPASITKQLDVAWAVGTNQGGLSTGAIANTTYHVWLIMRGDTGIVDVLLDVSATAPTMPANYTFKRRIGSIVRLSGVIRTFVQRGDEFRWKAGPFALDHDGASGTSANTITHNVPIGAVVHVFGVFTVSSTASAYISSLDLDDLAPSVSAVPGMFGSVTVSGAPYGPVKTNTAGQTRFRTNTSVTVRIATWGWIDRRGQDD